MPFCIIILCPQNDRISTKDHGGPNCPSVVPFEILHYEGPFEVASIEHFGLNDPSIWQPWMFSLRIALWRAIYPVWNTPIRSSRRSSNILTHPKHKSDLNFPHTHVIGTPRSSHTTLHWKGIAFRSVACRSSEIVERQLKRWINSCRTPLKA